MIAIRLQSEPLTQLGNQARAALVPGPMAEAGGAAVKLLLVNWFTDLEAARHREGGEHFYANAARSTQNPVVQDATAVVVINAVGLAQRYFGGTIKPVNGGKYLAIPNPNNPDAIGHTPADFPNLQFFKTKRGGGLKLQREVASVVGYLQTGKNKGKTKSVGSEIGDVVFFWLVPEVDQAPDPTVLPDEDALELTAYDAMNQFLIRRLQQGPLK